MNNIRALFLDPRIWKIDYLSSPFWNPEKFGVNVQLHPNAFNIPKIGIDKNINVIICTEVWEKPMQKTLHYLRSQGKKIVLVPREISPAPVHLKLMFDDPVFEVNGQCYFEPDAVLAPGQKYANLWANRCSIIKVIGYPRYDIWATNKFKTKEEIRARFGIENKKIVFFPAYPPYHLQKDKDGNNITVDLYDDLQNTLAVLEKYAKENEDNVQVVVKIHPMAQKCYDKGTGNGKEVSGLLEKYYKYPTSYMKVIGDIRQDSSVARELVYLADTIVGYTSMMMLEAVLLNKPVLHVKLQQTGAMKDVLDFSHEMHTVQTEDALYNELINMNEDKLIVKNSQLLKDYFYNVDGKFCERLCTTIKEICNGI